MQIAIISENFQDNIVQLIEIFSFKFSKQNFNKLLETVVFNIHCFILVKPCIRHTY